MAPAYKLTYFNVRALAETSRYLLKYGGIEFEDVRIKHEDWPQLKDKTPFGQLPTLEHNGKTVSQSLAIARYLAKQVKLDGNNDWENLEIDAVVDTINDIRLKCFAWAHEKDEEKKATLLQSLNETFAYVLPRLEAQTQKNKGYLAVGRLTWVDFYFATISTMFDAVTKSDNFANYPNLKAVREKVEELPAIKQWIKVRPQTDI